MSLSMSTLILHQSWWGILLKVFKARENYSLWFCPLPFCPFALLFLAPLPFCPFALMSLPLLPPCLSLSFGGYQENTFFVFVFTFRFMCRYRRLSWCYSCLHRWQLRPSSFGEKLRLCPFWLQILKLFLNIWRLEVGKEQVQVIMGSENMSCHRQILFVLTFNCLKN